MYDELIKNLRICSKCDFGQNCNECTQESTDKFCCDELLHQAADAIEELSKPRIISIDHQLSEEEIERLRKEIANAPIVLIPAEPPKEETE